jgi:hypothetical protein
MKTRTMLIGAACGCALQLAALGLHLGFAGWPLRPFPGCGVDPGGLVLNLPAGLLGIVARVEALAPQEAGKVNEARVEAAEARWSPAGFALLGFGFYALLGAGAGLAAGAARSRARRS